MEEHRQERQDRVRRILAYAAALEREDAVDLQPAAATLESRSSSACLAGALPTEAVGNHDKRSLARDKRDVADAQDRVLQMRRDDRQVLRIERCERHRLHGLRPAQEVSRSMSAPHAASFVSSASK